MTTSGVIVARGPRPGRRRSSRRRKLLTRSAPVVVLAAAAFFFGARLATAPGRAARTLVTRYVTAYSHDDVARMYGMLDDASRASVTEKSFAQQLQTAADTATATTLTVVKVGPVGNGTGTVQMTVATRLWGVLHETLTLPLSGTGSATRVHLQSSMLFPGLRSGETLGRHTRMPTRGTLLADNGDVLAAGPERLSPDDSDVAEPILGTLTSIPSAEAEHDAMLGYPPGTQVGEDGLEHIFQSRLAGTPGGTLLAGTRVLATARPVKAPAVRTTIDPALERATIAARAGAYAGLPSAPPSRPARR